MSTISQEIAEQMVANDGRYGDDTQCSKIVSYDNAFGGTSWAVVYPHEDQMRYENSPYCTHVLTLWKMK